MKDINKTKKTQTKMVNAQEWLEKNILNKVIDFSQLNLKDKTEESRTSTEQNQEQQPQILLKITNMFSNQMLYIHTKPTYKTSNSLKF